MNELRRGDLDPDPLEQFRRWFEEAGGSIEFPEAVALATADAEGRPSVRMVLAKGFDEHGFKFHTGHGSRKARELDDNPRGALLFYWHSLRRQVRIEGPVTAAWARRVRGVLPDKTARRPDRCVGLGTE